MIVLRPAEALKRFGVRPCAEISGSCVMKVATKYEVLPYISNAIRLEFVWSSSYLVYYPNSKKLEGRAAKFKLQK